MACSQFEIVFIITGFICNNQEVKQVVLINHNSISTALQRGWGVGVLFILQKKMGEEINISPKKTEIGKIVGGRTYVCKSKKHCNPGIYKSKTF